MCTLRGAVLVRGTGDKSVTTVLMRGEVVRVAGCNVRTLRDEGTWSLNVKTLHKYGDGVASLSEVCLPDSGHRIIKVPESDFFYHIYHSGVEDSSGMYVRAIALSPLALEHCSHGNHFPTGWPLSPQRCYCKRHRHRLSTNTEYCRGGKGHILTRPWSSCRFYPFHLSSSGSRGLERP